MCLGHLLLWHPKQDQIIWRIIETPSDNSSGEVRRIYLYFCTSASTAIYHLPKHMIEFVQSSVLVSQDFIWSPHLFTTTSVFEYVHYRHKSLYNCHRVIDMRHVFLWFINWWSFTISSLPLIPIASITTGGWMSNRTWNSVSVLITA